MTLVRPSAVVTLDGRRLTSAEGAVLRARVRLGMGLAHDAAEIYCWPSSKLKDASVGATVSVALGDAGGEADVWTGEVTDVRLTPDGVALEGLASSIALWIALGSANAYMFHDYARGKLEAEFRQRASALPTGGFSRQVFWRAIALPDAHLLQSQAVDVAQNEPLD